MTILAVKIPLHEVLSIFLTHKFVLILNVLFFFYFLIGIICFISDLDYDDLTIKIALILDVENQMEKKEILLKKWNALTSEQQTNFYENINEHDFYHYSMLV